MSNKIEARLLFSSKGEYPTNFIALAFIAVYSKISYNSQISSGNFAVRKYEVLNDGTYQLTVEYTGKFPFMQIDETLEELELTHILSYSLIYILTSK